MSHSHDEKLSLPQDQIHLAQGSMWRKMPIIGAVLGAAGLGGAAAMMGGHEHEFWYAYLVAYMVFLALLLIYLGILGAKFQRINRDIARLGEEVESGREREPAGPAGSPESGSREPTSV